MEYAILDTDVASFLFKRDSRALQYQPHFTNKELCVSFQTVAEIYQWAEMSHWGLRRYTELKNWMLNNFIVLAYDDEIAHFWARIRASCSQKGKTIAAQDAWIASCAMRYRFPLITHNRSDFAHILGLILISEAPL